MVTYNDTFRSKIGFAVEKFLKLTMLLVFKALPLVPLMGPEAQILAIDTVSQNKLNDIRIHKIWRKF